MGGDRARSRINTPAWQNVSGDIESRDRRLRPRQPRVHRPSGQNPASPLGSVVAWSWGRTHLVCPSTRLPTANHCRQARCPALWDPGPRCPPVASSSAIKRPLGCPAPRAPEPSPPHVSSPNTEKTKAHLGSRPIASSARTGPSDKRRWIDSYAPNPSPASQCHLTSCQVRALTQVLRFQQLFAAPNSPMAWTALLTAIGEPPCSIA
jgi:hypothetical protein